jgi:hypothetical protein
MKRAKEAGKKKDKDETKEDDLMKSKGRGRKSGNGQFESSQVINFLKKMIFE